MISFCVRSNTRRHGVLLHGRRPLEKLREFTRMDMDDGAEDAPLAMEKVTLGQIIHNNRDRLIYLFDIFGDRAYFLN